MARKLSRPGGPLMTLAKSQQRRLAYVALICMPILMSGCAESDLFPLSHQGSMIFSTAQALLSGWQMPPMKRRNSPS
jgi:hypothetical protein